MSQTTTEASIDDLKRIAYAKAAQDDAFRAELLANPRAAIEKLFNCELPPHVTLQAVEERPNTFVVPVPVKFVESPDGELSDDDLEAVAGGGKKKSKKTGSDILGFTTMTTVDVVTIGISHTTASSAGNAANNAACS